MKILFLPNWDVTPLAQDNLQIQSPDKQVKGELYWFFRYFPADTEVDVIDRQKKNLLHSLEAKVLKFYFYQSLKAYCCKKKYDVVVSHGAQSGLIYSLLNRLKSRKKRPLHIIIDVGGLNGGRTNSFEVSIVKFALKSQPAIIYHSSIQSQLYETIYRNVIKQSRFIRFGANMDEFSPMALGSKNYILSFGHIKRDYETLLKAWNQVNADANLYIVGDPTIRNEKNIFSISKATIFQLKEYIAQCLFVIIPLPVFNYSYGQMSFIQSMAMGKPVIVTRTPSSIDYLQEGAGIFFVNPYDVNDMKQKISFLLNHRELLSEWGKTARSFAETHLNEKIMATEIYQFIEECRN